MGRETAVVIGHRLKQDQGLAGGVGGDGDADEVGFPQLLGGNGAGRAGGSRSGSGNSGAGSAAGDTGADGADGTATKKSSQDGRAHQKKLKFSFKEQREWDTIEDEIAKLEADLEALDGQIAESATNYGKLNQLMTEKAEKEALLEEKMDRWMYLQELAEKIAAQS